VVTAADARRVLGSPIVASVTNALQHVPVWDCFYRNPNLPPSDAAVTVQRATRAFLARDFSRQKSGKNVRVVPSNAPKPPLPHVVPGLGDEALWNGRVLPVRIRDWLLTITVDDANTPDLARSSALARLGLQRLPK
jgi:hypothetical protein